jgi:hypothetical protein
MITSTFTLCLVEQKQGREKEGREKLGREGNFHMFGLEERLKR